MLLWLVVQATLQAELDRAMSRQQAGKPDPLTVLFYDCGGQNVYQTANELFFTPRSVSLLVFDQADILQRQDTSSLGGWFENIALHSPGSPIILVGTAIAFLITFETRQKRKRVIAAVAHIGLMWSPYGAILRGVGGNARAVERAGGTS